MIPFAGTKTCSSCKEGKTLDHYKQDRQRRDGLHPICRGCRGVGERLQATPGMGWSRSELNRRARYGASSTFLLARGCEVCGTHESLTVDHNHETGDLRGVLCQKHNTGLGHFDDSIEDLERAISYLRGRQPAQLTL